jgi:lipopolysaccharide/colanic/teichoic acid biosynthesis glycosyltransferase
MRKQLLFVKRGLDILVSCLALIFLSPLFLIIYGLLKFTSTGPALFRWQVVGKNGKPFVGYKFRTMVVNADRLRETLHDNNEMTGPFFKMKNDPRITPFGRILRKFSLDELPQLVSVLKGDMSLVGPRPTQVFEYDQLKEWHKRRTDMNPGCVCLWQVQGKTRDFDEMVRMDLEYIDKWSLWVDFKVLARAALYIIRGENT